MIRTPACGSKATTWLEASGPVAALEVSEQHPGPLALLVTDMVMPRMGGVELIRRFRDARPGPLSLALPLLGVPTLHSTGRTG